MKFTGIIATTALFVSMLNGASAAANNIRGAKSNGRVSNAIRGTTEVRIPVDVPMLKSAQQDTSLVLFGDWLFATKDSAFKTLVNMDEMVQRTKYVDLARN